MNFYHDSQASHEFRIYSFNRTSAPSIFFSAKKPTPFRAAPRWRIRVPCVVHKQPVHTCVDLLLRPAKMVTLYGPSRSRTARLLPTTKLSSSLSFSVFPLVCLSPSWTIAFMTTHAYGTHVTVTKYVPLQTLRFSPLTSLVSPSVSSSSAYVSRQSLIFAQIADSGSGINKGVQTFGKFQLWNFSSGVGNAPQRSGREKIYECT